MLREIQEQIQVNLPSVRQISRIQRSMGETEVVMSALASYLSQFSKSVELYLLSNQPVLQLLVQVESKRESSKVEKNCSTSITFFRNVHRTLSELKSNVERNSMEIQQLSVGCWGTVTNRNMRMLSSRSQKIQKHDQRVQNKNYKIQVSNRQSLGAIRRIMSERQSEKHRHSTSFFGSEVSQTDKRSNYQLRVKYEKIEKQLSKFQGQTNNKVEKYCEEIEKKILTFNQVFYSESEKVLDIIKKSPSNRISIQNDILTLKIDEALKRLKNKQPVHMLVQYYCKQLRQCELNLARKVKSVRLSCKIIVDIYTNMVLSFQEQSIQSKKLSFVLSSDLFDIHDNVKKRIKNIQAHTTQFVKFIERFVKTSLPIINDLINEYHFINQHSNYILQKLECKNLSYMSPQKLQQRVDNLKSVDTQDLNILSNHVNKFQKIYTEALNVFNQQSKFVCQTQNTNAQNDIVVHKNSIRTLNQERSQSSLQKQENTVISSSSIESTESIDTKQEEKRIKTLSSYLSSDYEIIKQQKINNANIIHLIKTLFQIPIDFEGKKYNHFYQLYKVQSQQQNINIHHWNHHLDHYLLPNSFKRNTPLHFQRRINFDHPIGGINLPFLPKVCQSSEDQTLTLVNKNRFILGLEVENSGAPYTDSFKVYMRFDFQNVKDDVKLTISMKIVWNKWCFVKGIIESQTNKQMHSSIGNYIGLLNKVLKLYPYQEILLEKKQKIVQQKNVNQKQLCDSIMDRTYRSFAIKACEDQLEGRIDNHLPLKPQDVLSHTELDDENNSNLIMYICIFLIVTSLSYSFFK